MRKLLLTVPIVLLCLNLSYAQDAAELAIVRTLMGVSSDTPLVTGRSADVPTNMPIKTYVDVSGDTPTRDTVVKNGLIEWINERNKGELGTSGRLEVVSESTDAYVALIHFTEFPFAMDFVSGSATGQMEVNQRSGQIENTLVVSNTVRMTMIVYTYIVVREPNAIKILYRRKDPVVSKTTVLASSTRTKAATTLLRKEIDKEIDKRKTKSQGDKNTKSPEYKLRDEFERWLTSGGRTLGKG